MSTLSVLLPVRDAMPYLPASLASLWRQTFNDFEVVAVDDDSSDGSGEHLDRVAAREPRLSVVHAGRVGLPAALNIALDRSRAPWIARHDADDLSHRRRFELQLAHLRAHPGVAVVGSRVRLFPAPPPGSGMRRWEQWHNALLTHEAMANEMLIDSALTHGTALLRREWLERVNGWSDQDWAEDLDLWLRLLAAGAVFAKLPRTLYGWRQHPASATHRDPRYARDRFVSLKRNALEAGLLRDSPHLTLIGVGQSLDRWRQALGDGRAMQVVEAPRPDARVGNLRPPIVLVVVAATARMRWRAALIARGWSERQHFIFVA